MIMDRTTSCTWPNAASFVDSIKADTLNISEIVAKCPNVCPLVFGSGKATAGIKTPPLGVSIVHMLCCYSNKIFRIF